MQNFKIICLGKVCKIDKQSMLPFKTLKKYDPRKRWKMGYFFKFEILATNIDWSQILKNICQQLLSF